MYRGMGTGSLRISSKLTWTRSMWMLASTWPLRPASRCTVCSSSMAKMPETGRASGAGVRSGSPGNDQSEIRFHELPIMNSTLTKSWPHLSGRVTLTILTCARWRCAGLHAAVLVVARVVGRGGTAQAGRSGVGRAVDAGRCRRRHRHRRRRLGRRRAGRRPVLGAALDALLQQ